MSLYAVYILTDSEKLSLYIGITNDIVRRVSEHKNNIYPSSFTAKHNCNVLLYFEEYNDVRNAIAREKQLKKWHRQWKFDLIRKENPLLKDLSEEW